MPFVITVNDRSIEVPSNNRRVIEIVNQELDKSKKLTFQDVRDAYVNYYQSVLTGICPRCSNEAIKNSFKFCPICGIELLDLEEK